METADKRTRWQNAFIYAFVVTVMLLGTASILNFYLGAGQRELAARVDHNAAISVTGIDSIICILNLGVGQNSEPRSDKNVLKCLTDNGYIDIPTEEPVPDEG